MPHTNMITLDYGSGGKKTSALIENLIVPAMNSDELSRLGDGAVIKGAEELAFSRSCFLSGRRYRKTQYLRNRK